MKKILMAIVLCLVCTVSFGQEKWDEWDELYEYSNIVTYDYYEEDSIRFRNEIYDITTDYVFIQKYKDIKSRLLGCSYRHRSRTYCLLYRP